MLFQKICFKSSKERIKCVVIHAAADIKKMIPPANIAILIGEKQLMIVVFDEAFEQLQGVGMAASGKRIDHAKELISQAGQ